MRKSVLQDNLLINIRMSNQIDLGNDAFSLLVFSKKLDQAQQLTVLRLHLNFNSTIIKQITPFADKLINLQILNIGYNNITNLEALQFLPLPQLKELHLFSNLILNLRSLRKCYFPNLKYMNLVNNHLTSLQGVEQWNYPKLEQLYVYDNPINSTGSLLRSNLNRLRSVELGDNIVEYECIEWLLMVRFQGVAKAVLQSEQFDAS